MKLTLVRHGQSEGNLSRTVGGHQDFDLTNEGILQAQSLNPVLGKRKYDVVFTSDLMRAKKTADHILGGSNTIVFHLEILRELYMGKYEGVSSSDACKQLNCSVHEVYKEIINTGAGESLEELRLRCVKFYETYIKNSSHKCILIVGHSFFLTYLIAYMLDDVPGNHRFSNCGYGVVEIETIPGMLVEHQGMTIK